MDYQEWIKDFVLYLAELQDKNNDMLESDVDFDFSKGYNGCLNDIVHYINQNKPVQDSKIDKRLPIDRFTEKEKLAYTE
ncbi:hypothetical protein [Clostridium sp.]|jgi:hypothetical protein|uniref:hypothetical protein n=1 Tax=Clostridium sp. TaxID=1506 RepID=UPI002584B919|nr:hypothetical protein [Clostridium sp.]MDF2505917.1 hypothetical protein [Clostridium sp.]